ncbi:glycosyltransferase [Bradyrhizobium sp. ORS 375]|uniref:glycosyltransferase n=1 Tax=Bradyrhizobium sp. (strain ORS 375) TaxID=566679 RepID=UPI0002FF558E|nr:glycosyltransferase [Bradyrhizobium sp. ORS 375]
MSAARRIKVVQAYKVYPPDVEGGIPSVIRNIVNALSDKCECHVVVARTAGRYVKEIINGVKVHRIASLGTLWSLPISLSCPFALFRQVRDADVLALHEPYPLGSIVAAFGLKRSTRLVVHWHSNIVKQRVLLPLLRPLQERMLKRADAIVIADGSLMEEFQALAPHRDKVRIIPFSVDVQRWSWRDQDQLGAIAALRRLHPRLIVGVGRLVGYKGFSVLVEAMASVDGHLVLCGAGPDDRELLRQIRERGLSDRITLAGSLPFKQLRSLIQAADVFVLPSVTTAETFGLVQLEAMACGVPVVNTLLPTAVPHICRDGFEGLSVPPGDAGALATAIKMLLDDPMLASRLGKAGRVRAQTCFTTEKFAERIWHCYVSERGGSEGSIARGDAGPHELVPGEAAASAMSLVVDARHDRSPPAEARSA